MCNADTYAAAGDADAESGRDAGDTL